MPGCVFIVRGVELDLDRALEVLSFEPYMTHRKGDFNEYWKGQVYEDSGFRVMASEASGDDLWGQLEEAEAFLVKHGEELGRVEGIDVAELDFGYYCRIGTGPEENKIVVQGEHLKPSLLKRCGDLGVGISLSLYPIS